MCLSCETSIRSRTGAWGTLCCSSSRQACALDSPRIQQLFNVQSIPAVFVETTVSDRTVKALVAGAQARGREVAIGGSLYSDAMGPPGTYEGTYVGMIDHNVTTVAAALGGQTPPKGLKGLLARAG